MSPEPPTIHLKCDISILGDLSLNATGVWIHQINWILAGEILRMTHIARGLDSDGALLLDIVVNGHILQLPSSADINIKVNK